MQTQLILSDADWAWMAGIVEGEGTIVFQPKTSVSVRVCMTDKDVVETLDRMVPSPNGIKQIRRDLRNAKHKTQWVWALTARDDVKAFLEGILPRLHSRRAARTTEALERLSHNHGTRRHSNRCQNGHLVAELGIYISPSGKKHCRACIRVQQERYRERHRERYLKNHRKHERDRRKRKKALGATVGTEG